MRRAVVVLRADGGAAVGLGHLRRCVTLGQALGRRGVEAHFVVSGDRAAMDFVAAYNIDPRVIRGDDGAALEPTLEAINEWNVDVIVVDSYAIGTADLARLMSMYRVAVIDDLADRELPVDLVINGRVDAARLPYRVTPQARLLLGPRYLLLDDGFTSNPERPVRQRIERVLITVGGTDPSLLTPRLIAWTREACGAATIDVVVGPFFSDECARRIGDVAERDGGVVVQRKPGDVRDLMLACDLAITGGGQTPYELAAAGAPAVAIRVAENQTANLQGLAARNTLLWVGDAREPDLQRRVVACLEALAGDAGRRQAMSVAGRALVDGRGATRVAQAVLELCAGRRPAWAGPR